jgi:hypothetical protein
MATIRNALANSLTSMNRKVIHHEEVSYKNEKSKEKVFWSDSTIIHFHLPGSMLGIKYLRRNLSKTSMVVFSFVMRALTTPMTGEMAKINVYLVPLGGGTMT